VAGMRVGMGEEVAYTITNEQLFVEEVWDRIQRHVYVVVDGKVYDRNSSEFICDMSLIE
jgi:hypothetical protein